MLQNIPGTVLPATERTQTDAFSELTPVLHATGGLTLSQLCDLVGLNATTVQNWIKRGWVASPEGKRYSATQLARILLINLLRGSMQLEQIVALMQAINGSVADSSDDIIQDAQLYNHFCGILWAMGENLAPSLEQILAEIDRRLADYVSPRDGAKALLRQALLAMVLSYLAAQCKQQAQDALSAIL